MLTEAGDKKIDKATDGEGRMAVGCWTRVIVAVWIENLTPAPRRPSWTECRAGKPSKPWYRTGLAHEAVLRWSTARRTSAMNNHIGPQQRHRVKQVAKVIWRRPHSISEENTMFLSSPPVSTPSRTSIRLAVFAQPCTRHPDRRREHRSH